MARIRFTEESNHRLRHKRELRQWIARCVSEHEATIGENGLLFLLVDDARIAELNKKHLGHSGPTDVITFPYSVGDEPLEAEIYISTQTVAANAKRFKVSCEEERHRVIIHGVLHVLGYSDKTAAEQKVMRKEEDRLLRLLRLLHRAR